MICIFNNSTNPYFNLAAEEYAMTQFKDDVFMLWRNEPAIIVGKFQNSLAEINIDFVEKNNIKVVRRMTGGGAVFHDLGNLNFTFIETNSNGDFRTFTNPILEVLHKLGVNATFEGRNDLCINGLKISGNAQCKHLNRTLHHGTLLFSSKITNLSNALKVNPLKFKDKAVKSVQKRVGNISEHLKEPMSVTDFAEAIMEHIKANKSTNRMYEFSLSDKSEIEKLQKEKYETWNWNFGTSPKYTFSKIIRCTGGNIEVYMSIEKSIIKEIKFMGDFFVQKDISELENKFINQQHETNTISRILDTIPISDYILNASKENLIELMF